MGISVIIIHFSPQPVYREVLLRTISSVLQQVYSDEIEIIVADDGSIWSQGLLCGNDNFKIFDSVDIAKETLLSDLPVNYYLLAKMGERYNKAFLWNQAVALAKYDKLVFLDDDHPFCSQNCIARYSHLLEANNFVVGRIKNPDGCYRAYSHSTVQGTNFGMQRSLLDAVSGFGEYTSDWGRGEDSDIFWKIFKLWKEATFFEVKAYYAGNIVTEDLCSRRWEGCRGSDQVFIDGFLEKHGVFPHDNPSRKKSDWVKISFFDKFTDPLWRFRNLLVRLLRVKSDS